MVVPLKARGRILGAITFVYAEPGRQYTNDDLDFAEELARRAAVAVDNARLYESEQNARHNADVANRAKDDFLATVSHELRTPLNSMLGWTRLLRAGHLSAEKSERALETIERNAVTQAQLIEDLRDVSRIISGNLRLDVQDVDFTQTVAHAIQALKLASERKDITIVSSPDLDGNPITGNPNRLQQVLWNLLSNAIKFTPSGGRIDIGVGVVDGHVRITVSDSGRGIAPEFLPYVFDASSRRTAPRHGRSAGSASGSRSRATSLIFTAERSTWRARALGAAQHSPSSCRWRCTARRAAAYQRSLRAHPAPRRQ